MDTAAHEMMMFGGVEITRERYARIASAHEALGEAIRRAGDGPRNAGAAASAQVWREHGDAPWSAADLRAEQAAVRAAMEAHPDYAEWIRLSEEQDRRIARNRELGRPLLAYTDEDWQS